MNGIAAPRELVLASAGSGKTFWISSRIIGLVAHGENAESLLAATFTRKAAGQILDRVLVRLAEAALSEARAVELAFQATLDPARPLPADRRFWADVLESLVRRLDRLNVGTLDAFFMRAAASFESELGLPPAWRVPDRPALERLRSRALLHVVEQVDRPRLVELLRLIGRGDASRSVHDRLLRMLSDLVPVEDGLDPEVPQPWSMFRAAPAGEPATTREREDLAAALAALALPTTRTGTVKTRWREAVGSAASALRQGDWQEVVRLGLCQKVAAGEADYDNSPITPETRELFRRLLTMARAALRPQLAAQVEALGELTRSYARGYRQLQEREGYFDFSDVTRLIGAGDPLGNRADLYYRLDIRTRHLLLDEFQDTSLTQCEALLPLLDEVLSDSGRAGVIVADPKQSIYGWRGAEPSIVHRIGARYSLAEKQLATSFRSSQVVLDFANAIFLRIASNPAFEDDEVCRATAAAWGDDFHPHRADDPDLPGHVTVEVGPTDEGRSGERPLLCRYAARRVAELRESCPRHSIGILTRTNGAVARLFAELRALDLRVSQEGGNPLTDSGGTEAVLALLRMADHPGDAVARYHVARSPLGAIEGFRDHRDLAAAGRLAARIRRRLAGDGYGRTITELARRADPFCDAREARRLAQLAELAHRFDGRATLRPGDFIRLAASERIEDRAAAEIRVMTVHQAKGLEFDIVVLPQLDAQIFRGGQAAVVAPFRRDPAGRITAVFPAVGRETRCLFPELEAPEQQRRAGVLRDGLSALYVGITRARYALHAIVAPDGKSGPSRAITAARILREALHPHGAEVPSARPGAILHEAGDSQWHRRPNAKPDAIPLVAHHRPIRRLSLAEPPPGRFLRRLAPSALRRDGPVDVRDLLKVGDPGALARGSIVHAWLERIRWIEDEQPQDADLLEDARRTGLPLPDGRLREMLAEFRRWLGDPTLGHALSRTRYPPDATVERELPFLVRLPDGILEGVIDRLVLVRSGGRYVAAEILDFKTDRVAEANAIPSADRYRTQLAAYVDAVVQLYGVPREACAASLVWLESRRIETVLSGSSHQAPRLEPS
jgi:ATP-dependent helicase/nuclease subunit A